MTPSPVTGFATCLNPGCEQYQVFREIEMHDENSKVFVPGERILTGETKHVGPAEDTACPECHQPSAVMQSKPPTYPKIGSF